MSTLSEALEFISSWVQQYYLNSQVLKPGLSYEIIQPRVRVLPFELPTEIHELYLWRNGGSLELLPYPDFGYEGNYAYINRFFSLEEAITIAVDWNNGWFPLFDTDGDIFWIVSSQEKQIFSPIFFNDEFELPEQPVYESLTDMMIELVKAIGSRQ